LHNTSAASSLRSWQVSRWFMCLIEVRRLHSLICSAGRCRSTLPPLAHRLSTSGPGSCGDWRWRPRRRRQPGPISPPVGDFVPGFEASLFYGLGVPRNTPLEIVEKLNKEINVGLADPNIKARLADLDGTVLGGSPADFGTLIAEETEKWRKVIRLANIK